MSRRQAGFTLIEAMVVVTIIGILAAIGVTVLQKMVWRGRVSEVPAMFAGIAAKEEAYFAEYRQYVSSNPALSWVPFLMPMTIAGQHGTQAWPQPGDPQVLGFDQIGFRPDTSRMYNQYRVIGCMDVTAAPCAGRPCARPAVDFPIGYNGPGFIIEAQGDVNNDGQVGFYCATSHVSVPALINGDFTGQDEI